MSLYWNSYNIKDYFSTVNITLDMRMVLYNWLFDVGIEYKLKFDTILYSYYLCDSFLSSLSSLFLNININY